MIRERTGKLNIMRYAERVDVESVVANLTSKDPQLGLEEIVAVDWLQNELI